MRIRELNFHRDRSFVEPPQAFRVRRICAPDRIGQALKIDLGPTWKNNDFVAEANRSVAVVVNLERVRPTGSERRGSSLKDSKLGRFPTCTCNGET
jgi:hypothetical protein